MIRNVWKEVQGQVIHRAQLKSPVQELKYGLKTTTKKSAVTSQRPESSRCFPLLCPRKGDFGVWALELVCRNLAISPSFPRDPRSIRELPHALLAKKQHWASAGAYAIAPTCPAVPNVLSNLCAPLNTENGQKTDHPSYFQSSQKRPKGKQDSDERTTWSTHTNFKRINRSSLLQGLQQKLPQVGGKQFEKQFNFFLGI